MKIHILKLLLLLLVSSLVHAQEYKFGSVTKDELKQTIHPKDSMAPAAILLEEAYLSMKYDEKWMYDMKVIKKIKIYNPDGYDYATIALPYYYGDNTSSREDIKSIKAVTYNLEGNKIKEEKVKKVDIINEQTSERWKQVKFTFPNLKPGSVIEYTYVYESPNIDELPEWTFQEEIPVDYSKYTHLIPYRFGYSAYSKGYHPVSQDKKVTKANIFFSQASSTESYGIKSQTTDTGTLEMDANLSTYIATNVPKIKDEPFVNNHNNFMTSIRHELAFSKSSTGQITEYTTTWRKVSETLQNSQSFGVELDKTSYYQEDLDSILKGVVSPEDKMNIILNHVKNHMRWNNYVGIFSSGKLRKAYQSRTGSAPQINLMLTSMLRYAGLNANPVLVSTISNGIPLDIASTEMYNYVITAIEQGEEIILLDATDKYTAPNLIPTRCLNWRGQLVRPNGSYKEIQLNPTKMSKDIFIMNLNLGETGNISGQMRRQYTNQLAYEYRVNFSSADEEDYIEKLGNALNIGISEYKNSNVEELTKPVVQSITFEMENAADLINDDIYLSPLLFLSQEENQFKQDIEDRKLPLDFTYPTSQKYVINLSIPKGYKIDYFPEPMAIGLPNDVGTYRFNIKQASNGNLQIAVTKEIKKYILPSNYYQPMKDFYNKIVNKETDKIVLKKL